MINRNQVVDITRGFAMLLVVLGHTMSSSTTQYNGTFLFQVIWTLQMPLFIILSGYVTRYSRPLLDGCGMWEFVRRRTLAYIFPWLIWSVIVRGLILGQTHFLNIRNLLWHMDSGYWFLFTIWSISMIYGIADILSNKWFNNPRINVLSHLIICGVGMIGLAAIGYFFGFDFLAIKLTLYYFPIYLLGYLYGKMQDWLMAHKKEDTIRNCVIAVSLGLWIALVKRFDYYADTNEIMMLMLRYITSILGCIAVIGLLSASYNVDGGSNFSLFRWAGIHSLEIYLTHYLFLGLVPALNPPTLCTLEGLLTLATNFTLTIALVFLTIRMVQCNSIMNYLLYAKQV